MSEKGKKALKVMAGIATAVAAAVLADRVLTPKITYWLYKRGCMEDKSGDYCLFDFCDECPGCGTTAKEET